MSLVIALATVAVMTWVMWRYCLKTIRGEIHPVAASWIISSITLSVSFWTYWSTPHRSLVANIGNVTGVNAIITMIVVVVVYYRRGTLALSLNRYQRWCLAASVCIIVFWKASAPFIGNFWSAVISNIATQGLMLLSYTTIAEKLWRTKKNFETFDVWYGILTGSFLSLIAGVARHDPLATLYAGRWFVSTLVIVSLMMYCTNCERHKTLKPCTLLS